MALLKLAVGLRIANARDDNYTVGGGYHLRSSLDLNDCATLRTRNDFILERDLCWRAGRGLPPAQGLNPGQQYTIAPKGVDDASRIIFSMI